jgi:hypothetical protein
MGIGSRLLKGALGAGLGFATGGPFGALAGGASGLLSPGGSGQSKQFSSIPASTHEAPAAPAVPKPLSQTASSISEARDQVRSRMKRVYGYGG